MPYDYQKLGELLALNLQRGRESALQQQQLQQQSPSNLLMREILPVIIKSQIEKQTQQELLDKLVNGGNGPKGDFDISIGPSGITYKQKSPKEIQEGQIASRSSRLAKVLSYLRENVPIQPSTIGMSKLLAMTKPERFGTAEEQEKISSVLKLAGGLRKKPESDVMKRGRITREGLAGTVGRLEDLFKNIPSGEGFEGRLVGMGETIKGALGYNPKLTTYNDLKKTIAGQVAVVIGGESGSRLSDQDIDRMLKAFPSERATTTERALKWKVFKQTANDMAMRYGAKPIFLKKQKNKVTGEVREVPF